MRMHRRQAVQRFNVRPRERSPLFAPPAAAKERHTRYAKRGHSMAGVRARKEGVRLRLERANRNCRTVPGGSRRMGKIMRTPADRPGIF